MDRIDNSVPRVTVLHHSAEPRDAKQWHSGQNCLSYPQTHDRFLYSITAISKFSEAVIDYIANIDKAPDPTVKKEMFSSEIFAAYDVIFNVWLQSKEVKVTVWFI